MEVLTIENGWEKKTIETITKDSKGQAHGQTEVVWMNRHYISALRNNEVPIELTEHEKLIPKDYRIFSETQSNRNVTGGGFSRKVLIQHYLIYFFQTYFAISTLS